MLYFTNYPHHLLHSNDGVSLNQCMSGHPNSASNLSAISDIIIYQAILTLSTWRQKQRKLVFANYNFVWSVL